MSVIKMKGISIEFPGVKALSGVDFSASTGVAHALIGANGAGKSTLMKILSGAYGGYTGSIEIDGKTVEIRKPQDAKKYGIETVYQEVDTALVPGLSVAENIMLDSLAGDMGRHPFVNWKALYRRAREVTARLKLDIPLRERVDYLTLAEKQLVLIARALSQECRFLVLDEPTAPLSGKETGELFRIVRELKSHDVGIIFISHRLPELFEVCDEITVLRDGKFVKRLASKETTQDALVQLMLGDKGSSGFIRRKSPHGGQTALEVANLGDGKKLSGISLKAARGEIVGVTGLVGAGKTELCNAIFGVSKATGTIRVNGKTVRMGSPSAAVKYGLALIPEERRRDGLFANDSTCNNLTVTRLDGLSSLGIFLNYAKIKKAAAEMVKKLDIVTPGIDRRTALLSGGNQQKVVIGKWLGTNASLFIFDEPTKGVDVNAKKDLFRLIEKLADEGKSVIYASCEIPEIMTLTDRVYILYGGRVVKELATAETTEEQILYYSTGGQ